MSAAIELRQHYKAVRARIEAPRPVEKLFADVPLPEALEPPKEPERDILHVATPAVWETMQEAKPSPRAIADKIVRDVCAKHQLPVEYVLSLRRVPNCINARAEIAWHLREQCHWSYPKIGRFLGRDHSTAIWSVRRHQAKLDAVKP